ncbi:MAG: branched-chain amino acid ABC transporter permease [Dehalococcoidales bacterium]|nr:branched-chain amino acid ABC transporter permease [Dehalococcoidales bacterium]MDX9986467.1 branched-chain amino acid ABC transporter permease [Dehalococcoidales bacterium]NLE90784.1 branched-chain amino acid ABC transporter permease [Dehalococcoidales bacterium]
MHLPAGIRNYTYAQDMAIFRTKTQWAMLGLLLVALIVVPLFMANYWLSIFNIIAITIIAALGLNLLTGYCGQLSIGHAGFIAVGAYTSAILTGQYEVPFLFGMLGGGLMAGLTGVLFGLPSLRVKGFYLAISTIAAQFIIMWVISQWGSLTGGFIGLNVPAAEIFGYQFTGQLSKYYLIMAICVIAIFVAKNLARTRQGRAFVAIRDNDLAAQVMGINLFRYKLIAFFTGCFFAGISGALLAHCYYGFLNPEFFSFKESILYVGMIIIGGLGTTAGPIFGVVFIRLLERLLSLELVPFLESTITVFPSGWASGITPMLFGLVIVLFLIIEPRGLAHRWQIFKNSYRLWPFSY